MDIGKPRSRSLINAAAALRAVLALCIALLPAAAPAAESAFWTDRRRSLEARGGESPAVLAQAVLPMERPAVFSQVVPTLPKTAGPAPERWAEAVLPYADLRQVHRAAKADSPVILHVQDLHDVEEAQRNIAALIESLGRGPGVTLVGVEGAAGDFTLDPVRRYVSKDLLSSAADYLLKSTLIGGPEYAGLVSADLLQLFGAEDLPLYKENLRAVREALKTQKELRRQVQTLADGLAALKETRYSPALVEYDRRAEERRRNKGSLAEYVAFLLPQGAGVLPTPNLGRFLEAAEKEKSLDFTKVAAERRRFLEDITPRLSGAELAELASLSARHRAAAVGYGEFFRGLDRLARAKGLSLSAYPRLQVYREYAEIAEDIDRVKFLAELESLERAVENRLAADPAARRIAEAARRRRLLSGLVDLSLSPDKWRAYRAERAPIRRLAETIRAEGGPAVEFPSEAALEPFEDFMELALRRDAALARNVITRAKAGGAGAAVLVAGGFHTEGIVDELARAGASVVVLTPRVSKIQDKQSPVSGFVRDPLPLEKLFAGQPVSLVTPRALAGDVNGTAAQAAVHNVIAALPAAEVAAGERSMPDWQAALSRLAGAELSTVQDARLSEVAGNKRGVYLLEIEGSPSRRFSFAVIPADARTNVAPLFNTPSVDVTFKGRPYRLQFLEGRETKAQWQGLLNRLSQGTADILQPVRALADVRGRFPVSYYLFVGTWETLAFPLLGTVMLGDYATLLGLTWSVAGFWAAHPVARWLAGPKSAAALKDQFRMEVKDSVLFFRRSHIAASVLFAGLFIGVLSIPGAPVWAAFAVTALTHTLWDLNPHPRLDDPFLPAWIGRVLLASWMLTTPASQITLASGDGDDFGAMNSAGSKDLVGTAPGTRPSKDVIFSRESLFWERREAFARIARGHGALVIRGVGNDEFSIVVRAPPAEAAEVLRRIRRDFNRDGLVAENAHGGRVDLNQGVRWRPRHVVYKLPGALTPETVRKLSVIPAVITAVAHAGSYKLMVDRSLSEMSEQGLRQWIADLAGIPMPLVEPLLKETRDGVSNVTSSIGAVDLRRAAQVLASGTHLGITEWLRQDGRIRPQRVWEVMAWAARFANDALSVAKGNTILDEPETESPGTEPGPGRNAFHLLGVKDADDVVSSGRVTRDKVLADRQSRRWRLPLVSSRLDPLSQTRTNPAFRDAVRREAPRYLQFITVASYLDGVSPMAPRSFHEVQGSDYDLGNRVIRQLSTIVREVLGSRGILSRAAPDGFYFASDQPLTPQDLTRISTALKESLSKNPKIASVMQGRPAWNPFLVAFQVSEDALPTRPAQASWYGEAMADLGLLAKTTAIIGESYPWVKDQPFFSQWPKMGIHLFADTRVERGGAVVSFSANKRPELDNANVRAQKIDEARGLAKLALSAAAKAHNAETGLTHPSSIIQTQTAEAGRSSNVFEIFPDLGTLNISVSLTPDDAVIAAATRSREQALAGWAGLFARRHRDTLFQGTDGIAKPFLTRQPDLDVARTAALVRNTPLGVEAFAGELVRTIKTVPNADLLNDWPERAARDLAVLWGAQGDMTADVIARDVETFTAAAAVSAAQPRDPARGAAADNPLVVDRARFKAVLERFSEALNAGVREIARLRLEMTRYRETLSRNRNLIIDVTELEDNERWRETFARLAAARRANLGSTSQILFVNLWEKNAETYEKKVRAMAVAARFDIGGAAFVSNGTRPEFFRTEMRDGRPVAIAQAAGLSKSFWGGRGVFDIYTADRSVWDLSRVEHLVNLLLYLAGDLLYDASQHINNQLDSDRLVKTAA